MFLLALKSASPQAFQGPTLDTSCRGKEVVAERVTYKGVTVTLQLFDATGL